MDGYVHLNDTNVRAKATAEGDDIKVVSDELSTLRVAANDGVVHMSQTIIIKDADYNGTEVSELRITPMPSGSEPILKGEKIEEHIMARLTGIEVPKDAIVEVSAWQQIDTKTLTKTALENYVRDPDAKVFTLTGVQITAVRDIPADIIEE